MVEYMHFSTMLNQRAQSNQWQLGERELFNHIRSLLKMRRWKPPLELDFEGASFRHGRLQRCCMEACLDGRVLAHCYSIRSRISSGSHCIVEAMGTGSCQDVPRIAFQTLLQVFSHRKLRKPCKSWLTHVCSDGIPRCDATTASAKPSPTTC